MRIGIDLDWTLADHSSYWSRVLGDLPRVVYFLLADYGHPVIRRLITGIWEVHWPRVTDGAWPTVLDALHERGHEVVVVTNREDWERDHIRVWLDSNHLSVDAIYTIGVDGDKGEVDIDVLVDDTLSKCYDVVKRGRRALLWLRGMVNRNQISRYYDQLIDPIRPVWSAWEVYDWVVRWE